MQAPGLSRSRGDAGRTCVQVRMPRAGISGMAVPSGSCDGAASAGVAHPGCARAASDRLRVDVVLLALADPSARPGRSVSAVPPPWLSPELHPRYRSSDSYVGPQEAGRSERKTPGVEVTPSEVVGRLMFCRPHSETALSEKSTADVSRSDPGRWTSSKIHEIFPAVAADTKVSASCACHWCAWGS